MLLCLGTVCSLRIGAYPLTLSRIFEALFASSEELVRHVIWNIRLPRIVAALLKYESIDGDEVDVLIDGGTLDREDNNNNHDEAEAAEPDEGGERQADDADDNDEDGDASEPT